jgi:hypothetical protein
MRNGRLALVGAALLVAALALGAASSALAQSQPGPGLGPGGMMGTWGYGPMMGGYGPAGMMGGWWQGTPQQAAPLESLDAAQQAFQAYLERTGNPDLVLGEVMEFENNFYAIIEERSSGYGAFELLANKQTGAVFPEPGPNMMWNTRYGHMAGGGMMGSWWGQQAPSGGSTVTPEQAERLAQQWLDRYLPGSTADHPDAFPGYYTLHTLKGGTPTGMLSVNAATGQVWYHYWHGAFIAATEG